MTPEKKNSQVVLNGKKLIDGLYTLARGQISKGDIHENQGYELQPKLDKWLSAYDAFLSYQDKQRLIDYFNRKMDSLVSKGSAGWAQ